MNRTRGIVADRQMATSARCVLQQHRTAAKLAPRAMTASCATTGSRTFTTQRSTRPSFVQPTPTSWKVVSMAPSVLLHTTRLNCLFMCWSRWKEMQTFTCSTSRQFGVLSRTKNTWETSASTHITGKTTEGRRISLNISTHSAKSGRLRKILAPTRMDASLSTVAATATVGKSLSIIHLSTRPRNVGSQPVENARKLIVRITTIRRKDGSHKAPVRCFSACIPEIEDTLSTKFLCIKSSL